MIIDILLQNSLIYDLFQKYIGGYKFKENFIKQFLEQNKKISILDLGCGTGICAEIFKNYTKSAYTGVDINERYISSAKRKKILNASFLKKDAVYFLKTKQKNPYNIIFINGFLHHLNISEINNILMLCKKNIYKSGIIAGIEPFHHSKQKNLEKIIMSFDRGKSIFLKSEWKKIFSKYFINLKIKCFTRSLYLPYSLITFVLKNEK